MNVQPPDQCAGALPTELSNPNLSISLICQYLCSGMPVSKKILISQGVLIIVGMHVTKRLTQLRTYFLWDATNHCLVPISILKVRNTILIEWVCIVECVDEAAFQCDHLIQIIYQDSQGELKTLYLQAKVLRIHLKSCKIWSQF